MAKVRSHIWDNKLAVTTCSFACHKKAGGLQGRFPGCDKKPLPVASDTKTRAWKGGVVVAARESYNTQFVTIWHEKPEVYSEYVHLHKLKVRKGQKVKRGQILGLIDPRWRHLHFAIIKFPYGYAGRIPPMPYIKKHDRKRKKKQKGLVDTLLRLIKKHGLGRILRALAKARKRL